MLQMKSLETNTNQQKRHKMKQVSNVGVDKVKDINFDVKMLGVKCGKLDQFLKIEIENDLMLEKVEEKVRNQSDIQDKLGFQDPGMIRSEDNDLNESTDSDEILKKMVPTFLQEDKNEKVKILIKFKKDSL